MPFLAVGGAERVALDAIRSLQHRIRFIVATTEPHPTELGSTEDDFRALIPDVFPASPGQEPAVARLRDLIDRFAPHSLYVANGSTPIYDALPEIKATHPRLRVVDQVYDHRAGWITTYTPELVAALDAHIGCNRSICRAYLNKGAARHAVHHIHHGVDTAVFDPARYTESDRQVLRTRLGLPHDRTIIAFLSRVHAQKRPMDFVALAHHCSLDSSLFFAMVGDGPLAAVVDREVERCGLRNFMRRSFYQPGVDVLAASDVVVLPSEYEGMPLVVLEAQAMGKPVVVTDVGNTRAILEATQGGVLVSQMGSATALREALYQVLESPPDSGTMRRVVAQDYALETTVKPYCRALLGDEYA